MYFVFSADRRDFKHPTDTMSTEGGVRRRNYVPPQVVEDEPVEKKNVHVTIG